jgi:hypothetical protein
MALTDRATISYNCGPKGRAGQGGKATTRGSVIQLTSANIVAQDAAQATWANKAIPLTKAAVTRHATDHGLNPDPGTLPTTPQNKGEKWVITMQENTGNKRLFTHTIPSADETGTHVAANTLDWNPADADWIAYKAAAEAYLTTPDGGAMTLTFATLLTRRR